MCNLMELAEIATTVRTRCENLYELSYINIRKEVPKMVPEDLVNKRIAMVWIMLDLNKELQWWSGTVVRCNGQVAIIKWDGEKGTRKTRFSRKRYSTDPRAPAGSWFVIDN